MKFCFFHLMPYTHAEEAGRDWPVGNKRFDPKLGHELYTQYLATMAYAESCGFDWLGCNEHHMSPYGLMSNPNLIASALVPQTKTVGLAVMGNLVPLLNPLRVAEEYAMVDVMSGGRLLAGMIRSIPHEYVAYNIPADESYSRLDEAVQFIKKAWTEPEPFGWDGEHYQFRAVSIWPRPVQQPHPRMIMSGSSARSAALAAKHGAMIGLANVLNFEEARSLIKVYRDAARDHGWEAKPSDVLVGFACNISDDEPAAIAELDAGRHYLATVLGGGIRTAQRLVLQKTRYYDDSMKAKFVDMRQSYSPKVEDLLKDGTILCGAPENVVKQIRRIREELDFGVLHLSMQIGNMPDSSVRRSLNLFRDRVLPHVRQL